VGAGAEIHFLHRVFQVSGRIGVELTVGFHLARAHRGIAGVAGFPEAMQLDLPCGDDPLADGFALLPGGA
jgi:hypothetical protein